MVNVNIKDEEFEKLVKDFIGKQAVDYCEKTVEKILKDETISKLKTFAIRAVPDCVSDYEIKKMYRDEITKQVKKLVADAWNDICEDIQEMIDEAVKSNLKDGRVQTFVYNAVKNEIHQYVEKVCEDFHGEVEK